MEGYNAKFFDRWTNLTVVTDTFSELWTEMAFVTWPEKKVSGLNGNVEKRNVTLVTRCPFLWTAAFTDRNRGKTFRSISRSQLTISAEMKKTEKVDQAKQKKIPFRTGAERHPGTLISFHRNWVTEKKKFTPPFCRTLIKSTHKKLLGYFLRFYRFHTRPVVVERETNVWRNEMNR